MAAVIAAAGCTDATRITQPQPQAELAIVRYGGAALIAATDRAQEMAAIGDSSLLQHLHAMEELRRPSGPRRSEQPTGSEPPTFVKPTYTRATISPYDAGVLVETSYKYAYHLALEGNWYITGPDGNGPSAPYSWFGNTDFDRATLVHHHAMDLTIPTLPSSCGLTLNAATTHTVTRAEHIPGYGTITWSPASATQSTWGKGDQNPCRPPQPCGTSPESSPDSDSPASSYECPVTTTGGGSGGGGGSVTYVETVTCYYIDYYDGYGNFLYSELEYCTYEVYFY